MKKNYKILLAAAVAALALTISCSTKESQDAPQTDDIYTESHIKDVAESDYEAAMRLIDDALRAGKLNAFSANSLRSNLTYQHTEDYAAAADFMLKALRQEEASDAGTRTELLYHLATIYMNSRDITRMLATCTEGKEYSKLAENNFLANAFDFLAGNGLYGIGEDKMGKELMHSAITKANATAVSRPEYGHLLYFIGQYINTLIEDKEFDAALEECDEYESKVVAMEKKFPNSDDIYLDRCRFYLDIDRAVCQMNLGRRQEAEKSFKRATNRDFARTSSGRTRMIKYYASAGKPEEILAIYTVEQPYTEEDTVNRAYSMRIARLREAYANAGMADKAREYEKRYNDLSEKIELKEMKEGTLVNAAKYDTQRYRYQLMETSTALKKNRRALISTLTAIVLAMCILLVINNRRMKQHKKDTESMEKSLRSIQRQVAIMAQRDARKDKSPQGEKRMTLEELIEGKQLYLDKNLNRESAAAMLGITPGEVSRMLGEIQPGISFPDYIKSLRIKYALEVMQENPHISITKLADKCGFYTVRTLQRSFLAVTGKTPSEYAKSLK
ncbi:MAG: AraC family transcriptional regulator [Bacteroidales bacterium]|nr:AraC family transcriptional regulator [Bacteroidales bacterium]